MRGERSPIPERWVTRAADGSEEGRAGALLRAVAERQPMAAEQLAELGRRLTGDGGPARGTRGWQLAVAAAILLCSSALAAAVAHVWRRPAAGPPSAPVPAAKRVTRAGSVHRHAAGAELAPPLAPPPSADPLPDRIPGRPVHPTRRAAASAPAPLPAPPLPAPPLPAPPLPEMAPLVAPPAPATTGPQPSPLAQESTLLASALHKLRRENDAAGALALVDEHRRRFAPTGALGEEADLIRVEALLHARRHAEALALLEPMSPGASDMGRQLLVARAELRAAAGRCGAALADFALLLRAAPAADGVTERALFGRASCRAQSQQPLDARADLELYLDLFPNGRFAADARAALRR